jgi:hypothetical protein
LQYDSDEQQSETKFGLVVAPPVPFTFIAQHHAVRADCVAYALCVKPDKHRAQNFAKYRESEQYQHVRDSITVRRES